MSFSQSLNQLNRAFYQTVSASFSSTRELPWPGWDWLVAADQITLAQADSVADIGCGNGRFGIFIAPKLSATKLYLGVDTNDQLLNQAQALIKSVFSTAITQNIDVVAELLQSHNTTESTHFTSALSAAKPNLIVAFGIWHHLPTHAVRVAFLQQLRQQIVNQAGNSSVWLSTWEFAANTRLMERSVPLQTIGLHPAPSDEWTTSDFILDWQRDARAYRYCHMSTPAEVKAYCEQAQLHIIASHKPSKGSDKDNHYYLLKPAV